MAVKSIETCLSCVYGANNPNCTAANCKKCDMCITIDDAVKCKCISIKWGNECPHYTKEAGR